MKYYQSPPWNAVCRRKLKMACKRVLRRKYVFSRGEKTVPNDPIARLTRGLDILERGHAFIYQKNTNKQTKKSSTSVVRTWECR